MEREKALAHRARRRVREEHPFVPLEKAQFIWNHDRDEHGDFKEGAFVVVPVGTMADELRELSSSTGADTEGWPDTDHNNPEFVFGTLLFEDWESQADQIEMIAEFAKIDAADWARRMLRGIAYNLGAFPEGSERSVWDPMESIGDVERFRDEVLNQLQRKAAFDSQRDLADE